MASINDALAAGARSLAGISDTADLDARVLLQHTLSRDHAWLLAHGDDSLDQEGRRRFCSMLEDRRRGEPVAYIIGWKEFWSLRLRVDHSVLVPRPETEHLVEQALELIPRRGPFRVADLGTGSGAVALAIASERPCSEITATDLSEEALRVARNNARLLGIGNVSFVQGDWFTPLAGCRFEMIVSNPPYIADNDESLQNGEIKHEPQAALRSGAAGLDAIHTIGSQARRHLADGGWILLEHGCDQPDAVAHILEQCGLQDIVCHRDYSGHPRITVGWKPCSDRA